MFDTIPSAYARTEMEYRSDRIKAGQSKRRRHTKRFRRAEESTESAR